MTTTSMNVSTAEFGRHTFRAAPAARWWVLVVLGIAQLMVVLDTSVVNIALPEAQRTLSFADADRQWIVTGYALAFGSLLLIGGRFSDMFGRRLAFMIGLAGFAIASGIGGAANSFGTLVAARVGQGVFGALLAPAALALLTVTFTEPAERTKAVGIFAAIAGAGGALGLLLGGALTEWASWRWAMYINIAFAAVALVGAAVLLRGDEVRHRPVLDLPGTATATAGLFSIVYGFSNAESHGWAETATVGFLAAGVVLLAAFVALQARVAHPLLPLRILTDRTRASSYIVVLLVGLGMFAVALFLTYYLQTVRGYSPMTTGVAFLPQITVLMVASATVPAVVEPRIGAKATVAVGFVLAGAGIAWLTRIGLDTGYASHVLPGLLLIGVGIGTAVGVAFQGATADIEAEDAGIASATLNTTQQVGGSVGTALLSTVAATAASNYLAGHDPGPLAQQQSAIHSYATVFCWVAVTYIAGAALLAVLMPNKIRSSGDAEPVAVL
ncbi:MFS transporter [Nocardia brasiliensis]|uniref:MFS transporter n=1 Tax=Nocardia brasiliensis TaxID=37326 RepID=UPI002456B50C|nr:MFS transporter [Nocardia brasiliensis]